MQREYGFLAHMMPEHMKESIYKKSRSNMQDAADALQWHIYSGLCQNLHCQMKIFNFLPIASYPQYYKEPFVRSSFFHTKYCDKNENIGFCNIKLIRNKSKYRHACKALKQWVRSNNTPKTVFLYTASGTFLKVVARLKDAYDLQVCVIIADLPEMRSLSTGKSIIRQYYEKLCASNVYSFLGVVDYYVLLTEHMAEYLQVKKPYCVMEGISTASNEFLPHDYACAKKTVFYAGTLHRRFGVLHLIEAFRLIKDESYQLIICGSGDCETEIREAAEEDGRIQFCGQLPRSEVLKMQSKSTVLINPRQNIGEFTKYSFPSKNLEYLSSGVPLVAYKLSGIPDDYDPYIYYVANNSVEALANRIREVCEMPPSDVAAHCERAREYVQNQKNELVQTRKILELIKK